MFESKFVGYAVLSGDLSLGLGMGGHWKELKIYSNGNFSKGT